MKELKDFFGVTFASGDRVVYPTRRGSELTMNSGRVVDIEDDTLVIEPEFRATWGKAQDEGQRLARVKEVHRVVIIDADVDEVRKGTRAMKNIDCPHCGLPFLHK